MKNDKKKPPVADRILEGLQEFAEAVKKGEVPAERFRCHTFDASLMPRPCDARLAAQTRAILGTSQVAFALLLGVSVRTVRSWEQGRSTPGQTACRFMDEIRRNPPYWIARLKGAVGTE